MLLLGVLAYVAVSLDLCDQIAVFSRGGGGIANSLNLIMYDLSTHRHIQYYTSMWDLSTKYTSIWDAFGSGLGRPLVAACERPRPPPARTPLTRCSANPHTFEHVLEHQTFSSHLSTRLLSPHHPGRYFSFCGQIEIKYFYLAR